MTKEKHHTIIRIKVDLFLRRKQTKNKGLQPSLHGWIRLQKMLADVVRDEFYLRN